MAFFDIEHRKDGVLVASYRNPPMGYFTAPASQELAGLIETWRDPAIRAVVICGAEPGTFITHYSSEELLSYARDGVLLTAEGPAIFHAYHLLLESLQNLPKPVIFGLTGDTMGGGFELALAGDIRIAQAGDYRYGQLEARLGITPGGAGTQRIVRMLGPAAAIEMLMRGRIFSPDDAKARGLVHEVAQDAKARAIEIASDLASLSPVAIAQIKRAVYEGFALPMAEGLRIETAATIEALTSERGIEEMTRYVALPYDRRRAHVEPKV